MTESRIVNALLEAIDNATEPTRELQAVGKLLVICSRCDHWDRGCECQDYLDWIAQLITPGRVCPF